MTIAIKANRTRIRTRIAGPLLAAILLPLALMANGQAQAQAYPGKPIRVIVPFPPGGTTDATARAFTARLSPALGQPMVVDNRGGATGAIGVMAVTQAQPDGYTLLIGSDSSVILGPIIAEARTFDPVKDLVPISILAVAPMVMVAHPSVKANTVAEVVAQSKHGKPGMFYASIGNGSVFHFAGEQFNQMTGASLQHVPYKGASPAIADLLGGQVQFMFATIQSTLPYIKKGMLKAIAVTGTRRSSFLPNVPTLAESGLRGYNIDTWVGLFAPAKTPPEVVNRLGIEVNKLIKDPQFGALIHESILELRHQTPGEFHELVVHDQARYTEQYKRMQLAN
jgi:tripartite-type tricarboxylate transporter receptor subunit TctC